MAKKSSYRSDVVRSARLAAQDLDGIGAIDSSALSGFNRACLKGSWDEFFDRPGVDLGRRDQPGEKVEPGSSPG